MKYASGTSCISLTIMCTITFFCACKAIEGKVTAFYTFGDSIVDPGNNNFIPTLARANGPPYGQDFLDGKATGRFCNGKLSTDFISAELGLKDTVPPYLDPTLSTEDLLTGVSFASAGTGFDNLTAEEVSVIPVLQQVDYFKEYKARLENLVGEESSSNIIREAIFLNCAGSNDFLENYFTLPNRQVQYSLEQFRDFLLNIYVIFIEELYKLGGRKFAIFGLPPMGCVPLEKTLYGDFNSGCVEKYNDAALSFNTQLMSTVTTLITRFPDIKAVYVDIYYSSMDIFQNPSKYGLGDRESIPRRQLPFSIDLNHTTIGEVKFPNDLDDQQDAQQLTLPFSIDLNQTLTTMDVINTRQGLDDEQKNQEYMQLDSIESNQASTTNDATEARYDDQQKIQKSMQPYLIDLNQTIARTNTMQSRDGVDDVYMEDGDQHFFVNLSK